MEYTIDKVKQILHRLSTEILGTKFYIGAFYDKKYDKVVTMDPYIEPRVYIQVHYASPCTKTGTIEEWSGRKWYLSEHMTDSEVIFTAYTAFKTAVEHEIMESFKVDGKILVNPHVNYTELLAISDREVKRTQHE